MLYAIFQINQNNMKTNIILFSLISLLFFSPRMKAQPNTAKHDFTHKENGWYHVLSTGSLSSKPIITVKDFVGLKLEKDYFGKYAISGQIKIGRASCRERVEIMEVVVSVRKKMQK